MLDNTEKYASIHLGKKSLGSESYDPSLLVSVPRIENRRQYDLKNENLPFDGYDIWHAYEFSALTETGVPFTKIIKLRYSCESEFIIESKSFKLYLNSFNMTRFGKTINEALEITKNLITKDLSEVLHTKVEINFLENDSEKVNIFDRFTNIMTLLNESKIKVENFKEAPQELLVKKTDKEKDYYLRFDSLRSNCRVTHQPDFGEAFIYYKSKNHIDEASLVKYLASFRSEYHFHEECCEMIFKRLLDLLNENDELFVSCLYTRRGGIDICPVRRKKNTSAKPVENLVDITKFARAGIMQ